MNQINIEFNVLKKLLGSIDNPIIIDVGANDGEFTRSCLAEFEKCKVFAFEPNPDRLIFGINDLRLQAFNFGLSSKAESNILYINGEHHGHSAYHIRPHFNMYEVKVLECESISLDQFAKEHNIDRIDYIKIDTEGHEMPILSGCRDLLSKAVIKFGQFEYGGTWLEKNISLKSAIDFFTQLNYEVLQEAPVGSSMLHKMVSYEDDYSFNNFYFRRL